MNERIKVWIAAVATIEAVSALTIFQPTPNSIACALAGAVVFWLAWKKPTIGLGAMLMELLIGSKGYLLQYGVWPNTISLRIVMTAAFLIGWMFNLIESGAWRDLPRLFRDRKAYLVLFIVIGYATLRGIALGNGTFVQKDGNAWGDWLLLFPVLDICWRYRDQLRRDIAPVFVVGILWLGLKTIGLEYIFSHGFKLLSQPTYLWVRRTGVGEVTLVIANAFRIFMQSYVYAVAAWVGGVAYWLGETPSSSPFVRGRVKTEGGRMAWLVMLASTVLLGISLSRSFWIGAFVGTVVAVAILTSKKIAWWKRLAGPISAGFVGLLLIGAVIAFPIPKVNVASLLDLFGSRTNLEEAAAVSRWHLLPVLWQKIEQHSILGSGFGATVTYKTSDPRILAENPDGMYTTYAFEWGWLEHWIKFGIIGIPLIAYLLWSLGRRLWKLDEPLWLRTAAVSSLASLAAIHVFTPYLNHPLGFLFFFVGEGIILSSRHAKV